MHSSVGFSRQESFIRPTFKLSTLQLQKQPFRKAKYWPAGQIFDVLRPSQPVTSLDRGRGTAAPYLRLASPANDTLNGTTTNPPCSHSLCSQC